MIIKYVEFCLEGDGSSLHPTSQQCVHHSSDCWLYVHRSTIYYVLVIIKVKEKNEEDGKSLSSAEVVYFSNGCTVTSCVTNPRCVVSYPQDSVGFSDVLQEAGLLSLHGSTESSTLFLECSFFPQLEQTPTVVHDQGISLTMLQTKSCLHVLQYTGQREWTIQLYYLN